MITYVIYGLVTFNVAILGWLIFLTVKQNRLVKKAEVIFSDAKPEKITAMLQKYFQNIEEVNENHEKLQRVLKKTKETAELGINKVAFLRYNPFGDVGSDQSFTLCLLNSAEDGFVISSIHSREGTRVYAKPVNKGQSSYNLSKEEQKAIDIATGNKEVGEKKAVKE